MLRALNYSLMAICLLISDIQKRKHMVGKMISFY